MIYLFFQLTKINGRKVSILSDDSSNIGISLSRIFELQVTINPIQAGWEEGVFVGSTNWEFQGKMASGKGGSKNYKNNGFRVLFFGTWLCLSLD